MRWYLGAMILLILGVTLQLGLLVYAIYVLIGVMLVSRYLAHNWISGLSVKRECSRTTAQIGEKAALVVRIENRNSFPVVWLLIEDSLPKQALLQRPPRIAIEGKRASIVSLSGGGTQTILYQVKFLMRGYYQIGPLLIESGDLFGLHRRFQIQSKPSFVLVYPKVLPVPGYHLASRRPIGEVRLTHRLFEDPTRISGVRAYQQGDPLNRIHWRATARTGILHAKTYEPSCVAGLTLLLDAHQKGYSSRREPHLSELAVTAAASLANAVYQLGQQVGLITNGRDAAERIREEGIRHEFRTRATALRTVESQGQSHRLRPVIVETRRGSAQLMRILETLARVELSDGLTFPQLIIETTSRLPRDATVVALLPDVPMETSIALGQLKRRGYAVTAILIMPDDETFKQNMGRLMAEGIDVRFIENEEDISNVCAMNVH